MRQKNELELSNQLLIRLLGLMVGINAWALNHIYTSLASRTDRLEESYCKLSTCEKIDSIERDHGERIRGVETALDQWKSHFGGMKP